MDTERTESASVIEVGQGANRLAIAGQDLRCGEPIEVLVGDLGWTPARVEYDPKMGWVGYVREAQKRGEASVVVFLRPGLRARRGG